MSSGRSRGAQGFCPSPTIGRTCGKWEEQWTERSLRMTPEERELEQTDWQAKIDDITKKKAAVGICANKTAPMTMNECVSYKSREYPKYHKQLNDAYKEKRAAYDAAGKFEVVGHEVPAPSSPAAASGGVGAAALGVAGAVALAALARRRRGPTPRWRSRGVTSTQS
ncbi:unnamed protein product [Prorocentrum cordatum]|uniref:PSI-F n=1 Tax=Prorocentrum cordatum TaxID=2364126 RepID=A0ABN9UJE7_9DINO|nr:unnamed protein product [Polarella glacialis]